MSEELFRENSCIKECDATVVRVEDGAIVPDRTVFYPMGGGQPGDSGSLTWRDGNAAIVDTRYGGVVRQRGRSRRVARNRR